MTKKYNIDMYKAEEELWLRAVESPKGIAFKPKEAEVNFYSWAANWRLRLHKARMADRQRNQLLYEPGHPKHGKSAFDSYVVKIDEELLCLRIEPRADDLNSIEVEDIE